MSTKEMTESNPIASNFNKPWKYFDYKRRDAHSRDNKKKKYDF